MAYGNDLALLCLDAVDYAIVSDKDLPYVVPAKFTHHHTGFRKVRKMFNAFKDFIFPTPGGSPVAALGGNVVAALAKPECAAIRPLDHDMSSCILALRSAISCALSSECDVHSPRSSSSSATRTSSMSSFSSTNWSQSSTLPMKEVGRPFCVMKMRRCVSAVRFRHAARLLRHSEKEMTSSERRGVGNAARRRLRTEFLSLTAGIGYNPFLMAHIVHDYVHKGN